MIQFFPSAFQHFFFFFLFLFLWEILQADLCESAGDSFVSRLPNVVIHPFSCGCSGRPLLRPFLSEFRSRTHTHTHTYTPRLAPACSSVLVPFWGLEFCNFCTSCFLFLRSICGSPVQGNRLFTARSDLVQTLISIGTMCEKNKEKKKGTQQLSFSCHCPLWWWQQQEHRWNQKLLCRFNGQSTFSCFWKRSAAAESSCPACCVTMVPAALMKHGKMGFCFFFLRGRGAALWVAVIKRFYLHVDTVHNQPSSLQSQGECSHMVL